MHSRHGIEQEGRDCDWSQHRNRKVQFALHLMFFLSIFDPLFHDLVRLFLRFPFFDAFYCVPERGHDNKERNKARN